MKTIKLFLLALAITCFACGPKVTTEKKVSSADLSDYKTFAYLPNSNFDNLEKFENDENVGKAVIESVNTNMKNQGYQMDRTNPDLLVLLTTMTDMEREITREPNYATFPRYYNRRYTVSPYYQDYYFYDYYDYNRILGYDTYVNRYKEGTLVLRLVDSDSKKVIWEGKTSDLIFQQNETEAISEFVDDMFDEFPTTK